MTSRGLETLDHVVVGVADLGPATRSYEAILGRSPSWRGEHPRTGTHNTLFRLSNTYLELLAPHGDGVIGDALRQRLDVNGEGLVALAFGTSDIEAFAAAVRAAGLEVGEPEDGMGRHLDSGAERSWRTLWLPGSATRGVLTFAIEHVAGELSEAGFDGAREAAVAGLDHVVIMSSDTDASRRVYEKTLGLRLALDRSFEERGVRLLFFRVGGVTVEIGGSLNETNAEDAPDNLWGLAYKVADVDAARRRMSAAGCDVSTVRAGHKKGTKVFTVRAATHGVATLVIGPGPTDG